MSSDLIPRPRDGMRTVEGRDPLAPRLPVRVKKAIDRESAWGLANAARAQAVGFVAEARVEAAELATERTMLGLDRLHRVESELPPVSRTPDLRRPVAARKDVRHAPSAPSRVPAACGRACP